MKKWLSFFLVFFFLEMLGAQGISAAEINQQTELFVAKTETQCTGLANCFFNDSPDLPESNALTKAIKFARDNNLENAIINVLSPYEINSHTIVIDHPVTIIGKNTGWISTSTSDCSRPMFAISAEVSIRDIHLTDGECNIQSRDLMVINSPFPVLIEHNTLENGQTAISYLAGSGQLTLQFNHINNNQLAVNSANTGPNARLHAVANNITSNGTSAQVSCNGNSSVDHNFWGVGVLPSQSAPGCGADDTKRLDAPILTETTGVAARLMSLTNSLPATDFYGFKASSPNPASLYVVNHAGLTPFSSSAGNLYSCSNYFDVFLPPSASPEAITLSFAYRDTNDCAPIIQSAAYCGSGDQTKFPLLWYDPKNSRVTDKWDKTGDKPQTSLGSIFAGQETTCRTASKTIEVIVDNNGRPDLLNDMFFTPFVIGYEQAGMLSFTATPAASAINLGWTTITEANTLHFYLTRSTTVDGTYEKISGDIDATGSPSTGNTYSYADTTAAVGQTYHYKLVVINSDGSVQQTAGPVNASIAPANTPTRTRTPTRTITPTRTQTPFYTATSAFRTSIPGEPTLFLPTITETPTIELTLDLSLTPEETSTQTQTPTPSRTPTPTISGTPRFGSLDKTDRYTGEKQAPFFLGGLAVLILVTVLVIFIHKRH